MCTNVGIKLLAKWTRVTRVRPKSPSLPTDNHLITSTERLLDDEALSSKESEPLLNKTSSPESPRAPFF